MANEKRLIDANALKQMFDEREADDIELYGCHIVECFPADDAKEIVDKAPTVDAVPVVHGHWEDGWGEDYYGNIAYKSIDCSNCNEIFKTDDREYWKNRFKVCPFCGAIMDGGNEDV